AWIIGPMIMLEIMRTKLPQYYLPAFPAWALLIARGAVQFHESGKRLCDTTGGRRRTFAFAALGLAGALLLAVVAFTRVPAEVRLPALGSVAVLAAGTMGATVMLLRLRDPLGW